MNSNQHLIEENIKRHDEIVDVYNKRHTEIYNVTEQNRLQAELNRAFAAVTSSSPRILDFGCGTGNLTNKLLSLGREVWATDVSSGMLELVAQKHPKYVAAGTLRCVTLSGEFPLPFPDEHFSFIATYSVLHHVPDYLEAVRELIRVLDKGGVLYIDHEVNANYWKLPIALRVHRTLLSPGYATGRVLARIKTFFGFPEKPSDESQILEEGDIHVYPDDTIEWETIKSIAREKGLVILSSDDYLLCRETSRFPIRYYLCRPFTTDMGIYVGRKE